MPTLWAVLLKTDGSQEALLETPSPYTSSLTEGLVFVGYVGNPTSIDGPQPNSTRSLFTTPDIGF